MSTARRFALAAVFLMFAAVLCGSVAQAEPDPRGTPGGDPSDAPATHQPDDGSAPAQGPGGSGMSRRSPLEQAQAEVRARQLVADRLQSELDAADRVSRSLATRAGLAAEAHDAAVARSAEARQAAADAAARFDDASRAQQAAESRIGSLAAERYRQGPDLTQLLAFTHVGSFRDLTDRQEALRQLSEAEAAAVRDRAGSDRPAPRPA
jgi:hypothetical protein